MKTKSALSYFGSDSEVAPKIAAMMAHCQHVTIPFAGGMSILPYLAARAVVANDIHANAINYYRVASSVYGADRQAELVRRCQSTLSHPDEVQRAKETLQSDAATEVDRAWAFWSLCWVTRKGQGGTRLQGGMPSVRRKATGGTNATRLRSAANDLEQWAIHFERCEWEETDFRELIYKVDDDCGCGLYCDPPWFDAGEAYLHSFDEQDHIDLANLVKRFAYTTVVVRYGDHPRVRQLYSGWYVCEHESRTQSNKRKVELWITNDARAGCGRFGV